MNGLLRDATESLRAAGICSCRAEARILWEHSNSDPELFAAAVARRVAQEPIAYIIGHKEFWSLDFEVGPGALIPRPETETLIEQAIRQLPDRQTAYRVLDLGIGSGCLLIAILKEYANATGVGIDCSEDALCWARRNVARHGLENRVELLKGEWSVACGSFDLIVSNPPYIPAADLARLPQDIRDYEPRAALDGGRDGFSAYRALAPVLKTRIRPEGVALLEIGAGQSHIVGEIMAAAGLTVGRIVPDLAGISRCLAFRSS